MPRALVNKSARDGPWVAGYPAPIRHDDRGGREAESRVPDYPPSEEVEAATSSTSRPRLTISVATLATVWG